MIDKIVLYLNYPFVQYALIAGVLIALCSSLLGTTLVLKRLSYIGDGLSRVAFGAMAVSAVVGLTNDFIITLPITIIAAIILLRTKHNGDAAVAMISVGALAFGYGIMNVFPMKSSNVSADVCTTLFGSTSIMTLGMTDVIICCAMSVITIIFFILFYNKLFAVTFDENFATAAGTKVKLYNTLIAIVTATVIALAMKLVGSLLMTALILFPAMSAMKLFSSFKKVTVASVIIGTCGAGLGILVAIAAATPVGSTIVILDLCIYIICILLRKILYRKAA